MKNNHYCIICRLQVNNFHTKPDKNHRSYAVTIPTNQWYLSEVNNYQAWLMDNLESDASSNAKLIMGSLQEMRSKLKNIRSSLNSSSTSFPVSGLIVAEIVTKNKSQYYPSWGLGTPTFDQVVGIGKNAVQLSAKIQGISELGIFEMRIEQVPMSYILKATL